jgi:hypothetical protein
VIHISLLGMETETNMINKISMSFPEIEITTSVRNQSCLCSILFEKTEEIGKVLVIGNLSARELEKNFLPFLLVKDLQAKVFYFIEWKTPILPTVKIRGTVRAGEVADIEEAPVDDKIVLVSRFAMNKLCIGFCHIRILAYGR